MKEKSSEKQEDCMKNWKRRRDQRVSDVPMYSCIFRVMHASNTSHEQMLGILYLLLQCKQSMLVRLLSLRKHRCHVVPRACEMRLVSTQHHLCCPCYPTTLTWPYIFLHQVMPHSPPPSTTSQRPAYPYPTIDSLPLQRPNSAQVPGRNPLCSCHRRTSQSS